MERTMQRFIVLMHGDANGPEDAAGWQSYISKLSEQGVFEGGSAMGDGSCFRKNGAAAQLSKQIAGYITVKANDLEHAKSLLHGNPSYEAGGTVELRLLLED
jgi:hypothetical protein